jgi:hypothetical protein
VVLYQDATLAAQGIVWQLRYRAASASAYKWEFIGGSPFIKKFPGSVTQAGGAFVVRPDLAGATILAAPLAGEYDTWAKAGSVSSDFGTQWLALLVCGGNAAPGSDADAASVGANNHSVPSTSYGAAYAGPNRITVAAAEVIRMYYRNVNGTATYVDRMGAVLPVRVG